MKFKKFFLTLLISLIIIPINAYAYSDKLIVGGNNIGIEVKTKGILVIGTYEINGEYINKDSNVKAGDYITKVNNNKIEKLIIPNEVSNIKEYSFGYCTGLKELTIPITIDASYANGNYSCNFEGCTGLNIIKFTKGTTGIGYDYSNYYYTPWYKSNNNKKIIIIDKEIISIGKNIFNGLNNVAYYYTGSQEEWANVSVDSSNAITIDQYNYKE